MVILIAVLYKESENLILTLRNVELKYQSKPYKMKLKRKIYPPKKFEGPWHNNSYITFISSPMY